MRACLVLQVQVRALYVILEGLGMAPWQVRIAMNRETGPPDTRVRPEGSQSTVVGKGASKSFMVLTGASRVAETHVWSSTARPAILVAASSARYARIACPGPRIRASRSST